MRVLVGRLLVVLSIILVSLAGCSLTGEPPVSRTPPPPDLTEIEELTSLDFPEDAELASSTYKSFQDWHLTAIITMPAAEVAGFFDDHPGMHPAAGERAVRNTDRPDDPQWDPDSAVEVIAVNETASPVSGVYRRLMFDVTDTETVTLYVVAFTT